MRIVFEVQVLPIHSSLPSMGKRARRVSSVPGRSASFFELTTTSDSIFAHIDVGNPHLCQSINYRVERSIIKVLLFLDISSIRSRVHIHAGIYYISRIGDGRLLKINSNTLSKREVPLLPWISP